MKLPFEPEDCVQMTGLEGSQYSGTASIRTVETGSVSVLCDGTPEIGGRVRLEGPRGILLAEVVAVQKTANGVLTRLAVRHFLYPERMAWHAHLSPE
jgi:hypothetical protein